MELTIGSVAHGGHCVARHEGRVVFVRHALPGERVRAQITEARHGSFARADAIDVLDPSTERIVAPCRHFHPGGCGGCDFQHATLAAQRSLKGEVVAEQLHRLGGVDWPVKVEQLPGDGFGWRTRVRWAVAPDAVGPRLYRSKEVVPLTVEAPCLIAAPGLTKAALAAELPRGEVSLTAAEDGSIVLTLPRRPVPTVTETVFGRSFTVSADGFWQVHPRAAEALVDAVLEYVPPGGAVWDLYSGVGLFAVFLADASTTVDLVESEAAAVESARSNVAEAGGVTVHHGRVERVIGALPAPDTVVLDPPRSGAGRAVCTAIAEAAPSTIVYVACDPAALGRDTGYLRASGYELTGLRVFDAFPQTHHVECVARFTTRG